MSHLINSYFLLVKKNKNSQTFNDKFINEKRIDNYEFFNILLKYLQEFSKIFSQKTLMIRY